MTDDRPNVVVLLLDDVRADDPARPFVELPHLDRMARQGAALRNAFTVAPLCSPSRAAFLTGQYPHNNTIVDNRERGEASHRLVTFPRLLSDEGYRTGFVGKWHMDHDDDTRRPGFDRWVSFEGQGEYFDPRFNVDADGYRRFPPAPRHAGLYEGVEPEPMALNIDLAPTVLELAGPDAGALEVAAELRGRLAELLTSSRRLPSARTDALTA